MKLFTVLAIARRDMQATWLSPVGWMVTALFLLFTAGIYFGAAPALLGSGFAEGQPASLGSFFEVALFVFFLVGPAISMRSLAEETRSGTMEILLTSPLTEGAIVLGKFLGSLGFLVLMLAPTLVFVVALEWYGQPDYGEIATGYAGLLLVGATCLASGLLASSLTSSQVLAYLGTVFGWLILLLATMGLPIVGGLAESSAAAGEHGPLAMLLLETVQATARFLAAANPLQRQQGFVIGLVDSFDIVFFLSFTVLFLTAATRGLAMRRWPAASQGRRMRTALSLIALGSVVAIASSTSYFAARPELRLRFDATKTRAYSLSPQTLALLDGLSGSWRIAVVLVEQDTEIAVRRQADEVLRRFEEASDAITVSRIDPARPETLPAYEALLDELRAAEAPRIAEADAAMDIGAEAFANLQLFAQQYSAPLEQVLARVPANDPAVQELGQRLSLLGLLAREGGQVLDAVAAARAITDLQPVPDYDAARSALAGALLQWSDELSEIAEVLDGWGQSAEIDAVARKYAGDAAPVWASAAQQLATAADPLLHLEPLEISSIGRALQTGEVAIVLGARGAAVIPQAQLFPRLPAEQADGGVSFDRRFRGEQVIAAAIRSLQEDVPPMVVFVHAEADSLLRPRAESADLVGVTTLLRSSRFDVREWRVVGGERPAPRFEQPVVWVIVPPLSRTSLEPDSAELSLIDRARSLIEDGESVLLSVHPSRLPRYRRIDPWSGVAETLGVRIETGTVITEAVPRGDAGFSLQPNQGIRTYETEHAIGRALDGQLTYIVLPVPVRVAPEVPGVIHTTIVSVPPGARRWLEPEWQVGAPDVQELPVRDSFTAPIPVVIAAERGEQRVIIVGSGGWMLTRIADAVTAIGGGRMALMHPGNPELLMTSIAWLAHRDELIAPSPVQQQVARLDGLADGAGARWAFGTIVGMPGLCLLLGLFVAWRRRA